MRISASRLSLARHCLHWARPDAEWDDKPGPAAFLGIAVDNHLSAWVAGKETPKHTRSNKRREQLIAAGLAFMKCRDHSEWRPQVTFAYDWTTGEARELGQSLERDYSGKKETEICGTADVFAVYRDYVYVLDWKTGRQISLQPAKENDQLGFLAMCGSKVYGRSGANVEICHLQEGGPMNSFGELQEANLEGFERNIVRVSAKSDAGDVPPVVGSHCYEKFCPHRSHCVAYKSKYKEV